MEKSPKDKVTKKKSKLFLFAKETTEEITVSHPYKICHQTHVDYTWDKGYVGLPKEWGDKLGLTVSRKDSIAKIDNPTDDTVEDILETDGEDSIRSKIQSELNLDDFITLKDQELAEVYDIGEQFAEGTGAQLYLGVHKQSGQNVAIKKLKSPNKIPAKCVPNNSLLCPVLFIPIS